jgi:hypothetical protein
MFMPRQLSHTVEHIARQSVGKDWGLYAALLDHWRDIVGADYAETTTPVKITFPHQPNEARRQNGTLTILLPKGLAMEFTYKIEQIRQRINSYFGYEAIARIVFDPAFSLPPKTKAQRAADPEAASIVKAQVQPLDNSELRDALQSFGESILASEGGVKEPDEGVGRIKNDG